MKKLTPQDMPQSVKSAVNAYLMARTYAECEKEKVDSIALELLTTAKYYTDPKFITRARMKSKHITKPKDAWMMTDSEHIDYLIDLKHALRKAGYEIEDIKDEPDHCYKCPALSAEYLQTQAQWLIIDTAGEMLGETGDFQHKLLCAGLDKYHEFIDLVVKMVVNMPDFKNPLTGRKVA